MKISLNLSCFFLFFHFRQCINDYQNNSVQPNTYDLIIFNHINNVSGKNEMAFRNVLKILINWLDYQMGFLLQAIFFSF